MRILTALPFLFGLLLALGGAPEVARAAESLAADAPIPAEVPRGTRLVIGDPIGQKALILSGQIDKLPFAVDWANISGGPLTIEAFRAGALDIGSVADIPPIHATWTGVPVKIVATSFRQDPIAHPLYQLGIAPGVKVTTLADLKGKKIAFSPGQAQGILVLRALEKAGLSQQDVELVEMPSPVAGTYGTALGSKLVDVAPIGGAPAKHYIESYGRDGATLLAHGLRDDPGYLYVPAADLADPAKAAAIRAYVGFWGRARAWIDAHPQEWAQGYYVEDQGLSAEDAKYVVDSLGKSDIPGDWTAAIERQQATIALLAKATSQKVLNAADLFDRRFEHVAAEAFAAEALSAKAE
jgi:sulfonate transport system substrate-binding protein